MNPLSASAPPADPALPGSVPEDPPSLRIRETTACVHCGLPVPRERRSRGDRFCCEGCRRVHDLIHDAGLDRFYELRRGSTAPPAELRPDSFAWLERLLAESPAPEEGGRRLTLDVQGVHCAACIWLLQELFSRRPGAVELRINPSVGKAEVAWTGGEDELRGFLREAERFGYRFGPSRKKAPRGSSDLLVRLGICAAAAMNVMIFSLSFYFGLAPADGLLYPLFGWLNLGLGTVAVAAGGWIFFRGAWRGMRRGLVHLDLPIALGIALAYGGSVLGHLARGPEAAYFDSLTVFITLMVVGRWLQERLLERNRQTLLASEGVEGLATRRLREERLESVAADRISRGDEIWVVPGDLVPVDGILLLQPASVSHDWIDGESRPRALAPGDCVRAGSFNAGSSTLRLCAVQDFPESRLNDLLRQPAPGQPGARKPAGWWHRVSAGYVAAVLVLSTAGFLAWLPHSVFRALEVTISILVVTCPCALGLATPLAHDLVHGALRRRGIFLRDPTFLDRALGVRKILFDKTGTLTLGRVVLTRESRETLRRLDPRDRSVLYNLAIRSNHPASRALARATEDLFPAPRVVQAAEPVREIPGQGIEWFLSPASDHDARRASAGIGRTFRLGRRSFALGGNGDGIRRGDGAGSDRTVFSADGIAVAAFSFREEFHDDVAREIRALAGQGYEVHLLSGDAPERVEAAARALGIPPGRVGGALTPEEKAARVASLDRDDTLMVGDGLNDGPAFEASWTAATPAVDRAALPARADFYFLGGGISAVRRALSLARRLRVVVRDDLILAALYNALALGFCFAGVVTPVVAAVVMPLSSAGVVSLTAARLSERRIQWK